MTQSGKGVSQGLASVRKAARENKEMKFTALLHHMTVELLRESFYALKRKATPGVDGVTMVRIRDRAGRSDSSTYTVGSIAGPTGHNRREGSTSRSPTGGNARWRSRLWKTKSSKRPQSPSSIRFTRKTGRRRTGRVVNTQRARSPRIQSPGIFSQGFAPACQPSRSSIRARPAQGLPATYLENLALTTLPHRQVVCVLPRETQDVTEGCLRKTLCAE